MRFHVVGLPHTSTTSSFSACAYTEKVRKFCKMMKSLGHTVFLYAGEQNEAPCDELIACTTEAERAAYVAQFAHYTSATWAPESEFWRGFNQKAADAIAARHRPMDFICVIGGHASGTALTKRFPHPQHQIVEFGVGYSGTFARYKVYESYAWMHACYGSHHPFNAMAADGFAFDTVINGYLEAEKFPAKGARSTPRRWVGAANNAGLVNAALDNTDPYFLFVGRLDDRKGWRVAQLTCQTAGARLVLAGPGRFNGYGEYVGVVNEGQRGLLMANAKAVIVPTIYVEPFGNAAIEALTCGTPVIASDWGAMTETVVDGVDGFRCAVLADFVKATEAVGTLDPKAIRRRAIERWDLPVIAKKYDAYFRRLHKLWGAGWPEMREITAPDLEKAA